MSRDNTVGAAHLEVAGLMRSASSMLPISTFSALRCPITDLEVVSKISFTLRVISTRCSIVHTVPTWPPQMDPRGEVLVQVVPHMFEL